MIRKRVCGPRRLVLCYSFKGTDTVVKDPALSSDMDAQAYADSLFDQSLIKPKDGEQPTYWTVRPMPRLHMLAGDDMGGSLHKSDWWIRCCLRDLENFEVTDDNGKVETVKIKLEPEGDFGEIVSKKTMEQLNLSEHEHYALMGMLRLLTEAGAGPLGS